MNTEPKKIRKHNEILHKYSHSAEGEGSSQIYIIISAPDARWCCKLAATSAAKQQHQQL